MPVKTQCPKCRKPYTLADSARGKKVRCKDCQQVFEARDVAGPTNGSPDVQPAIQVRTAVPPPLPPRQPARATVLRSELVDDEIASAPRTAGPRKPLVAEPVEDDRLPRRRRAPDLDRQRSSALPWIVGGSVGGVALIATVVLVVVLMNREDPLEQALANAQRDAQERLRQNIQNMQINPNEVFKQFPKVDPNRGVFKPGDVPVVRPPAPPAVNLLRAAGTRFQVDAQDHNVKDSAFATDAQQLGCYYHDVRDFSKRWLDLHDLKTGQRVGRLDLGKAASGYLMAISPDGSRVAHQESEPFKGNPLTVWSVADGKVLRAKWAPYAQRAQPGVVSNELVWFAFLDRDRLLTAARNGQFDLWDLTQERLLYTMPLPPGQSRGLNVDPFSRRPQNIALSADRRLLALTNKDGYDLIDPNTGKFVRRTASLALRGKVGNEWSVSFSPDGALLAAKLNLFQADNRQHEYFVVWDVATGQLRGQFPLQRDFNTNGGMTWWGKRHVVLFNGIAKEGRVLCIEDGRYVRALRCPLGRGHYAVGSPDGRLWYAQSVAHGAPAQVVAVDIPEDELPRRPVPPGPNPQLPAWAVTPDGIALPGPGF